MRVRGPRPLATQRPQIADAAMGTAQLRNTKWRNKERSAYVNGKYLVPLFDGDLFEIRRFKNPCIVDQQVDPSEIFQDIFDGISSAVGLAKVAFDGQCLNAGGFDFFKCLSSF